MSDLRLTQDQKDNLIEWLAEAADLFCLKEERMRETRGTKAIRAFTATLVESLSPRKGEDISIDA